MAPTWGDGGSYSPQSITLPVSPTPVEGAKYFYSGSYTTTASYVKIDFKGPKNHIEIKNTGAQTVAYSFLGSASDGTIAAGDTFIMDKVNLNGIYLKNGSGSSTAEIKAWTSRN